MGVRPEQRADLGQDATADLDAQGLAADDFGRFPWSAASRRWRRESASYPMPATAGQDRRRHPGVSLAQLPLASVWEESAEQLGVQVGGLLGAYLLALAVRWPP